ncbi:DNA topoisomerase [Theobroma cacao]|nr:DNA topoisomerase [Theobroma cacao]
MSLSYTLRFSFLRHNLYLAPSGVSALRPNLSHLRFLSVTPTRPLLSPVKARRAGGQEDEDGAGNGSLTAIVKDGSGGGGDGRVVPTELHKEATESYMAYALSVLLGRALPDVRDGLKPVHRRILFAMHELGLSSRKPFKKCARVVGEVLGKFHPHGDTAVYDSLVRMAQDFSLRFPLIQGHGNFGSIDADPPAAMRYTECRLEVGMATNIPPHNLGELVDVLCALIQNPEASLQELLEYMPGPDFPTGGLIMGNLGILEAYRTGRGRIVVRGKADIELLDSKTKRSAVIIKEVIILIASVVDSNFPHIVHEWFDSTPCLRLGMKQIPYQTNKSSLVEKIAELVENKSLEGISDIRDESDRSGMRVVIELKRGSDPSIVLNNLYRLTALQSSFSCNMVGILDGQPKQMGLKELLQAFLDFRCSVVERRARYKLSQAQDRRHIVEGIVVGLDNLDSVIDIIREASSNAAASAGLRNEFNLSDKQAEAILDINLRRLNLLERKKFVGESRSLMEQISKLTELLSSRKNILQLIEQEAIELKSKFRSPRRSILEDSDGGQLEDIDVIPNEEMLLAFSEKGYVKRMKPNTFNLQNRGTIGKSVGKLRFNDAMSDFIVCRAHDHVLYFSDKGIVYTARAYKIPESSRTAAGTPLVQIISLSEGERITSIISVSEFAEDQFLAMLTVNGYIKKVSLNYFSAIRSTGIIAIQLVPGDELKWVRCCINDDLVAMASQNGMIRALSRNTRGAIAMRLKEGDKMASMDIIPAPRHKDLDKAEEDSMNNNKGGSGPWLLFVSENGYGKRVPLSSFKRSPLNRVGLIGYKFSSEDRLAAVFVVGFSLAEDGESDEQVVLVSQSGTVNRIKVRDISIQSRYARGVILMRLEYAGKIQSASLISASAHEAEELLPDMLLEESATNVVATENISEAS